ncbi:unnamed protein product [Choristocarpus tenellus]
MSGVLFEDIFEVNRLNPDGKKFDRVNRLSCRGVTYDMDLLLDINCEIYKVKEADRLTLMLASTLDISGKPDDGTYRPLGDEVTLADKFEYVMHGRIFKCEHAGDNKVQVGQDSFENSKTLVQTLHCFPAVRCGLLGKYYKNFCKYALCIFFSAFFFFCRCLPVNKHGVLA